MPMYPYKIMTDIGYCWPHDTESNISVHFPPSVITSLHNPLPETEETGRALILQPVLFAEVNGLVTSDGDVIGLEEVAPLIGKNISNSDIPIIIGNPIYDYDVKDKNNLTSVYIPELGLGIIVTAVLIIVIAFLLNSIVSNWIDEQHKQHVTDTALESQETVGTEWIDVDTGETRNEYFDGADIERRYFRNGDVWGFALNQTGWDFLGASALMERKGIDFDDLLKELEEIWEQKKLIETIILATVVIGGVYIMAKVVPSLIGRRRKPMYRRAPNIDYVY
jgi:hypothetical protein